MTKYFLLDGSMGTYYQEQYGEDCFKANLEHPDRIQKIHEAYLDAGAQGILTNTFDVSRILAENPQSIWSLKAACQIAKDAIQNRETILIADIGPAFHDYEEIYKKQIDAFLEEGVEHFLFETQSSLDGLKESADYIKSRNPKAIVALSFAAGSDGMTKQGFTAKELLESAIDMDNVDIAGLNCLSSAYHMASLLPSIDLKGKKLLVMPNAGYPQVLSHRIVYDGSVEYFARQCARMLGKNAFIFGGCCGTTPEHIKALKEALDKEKVHQSKEEKKEFTRDDSPGFLMQKKLEGKKIIAVELDPPFNDEISSFMSGIGTLKHAGADIITIADNPIGRPRADSALLASKIHRETGIEALPHLTCRDRNLNAIKGLLLGLSIEDVHQVLVITGDPLPADSRDEVKSVYNFNSRKLAGYISRLNEELFSNRMHVMGALDLNARNFNVQTRLAKEKLEAGMEGFLTQPILSKEALENLKEFRRNHDCLLLAGIFPVVSYKNAQFLNNEVNGVKVADEICELYKDKDRRQSEEMALKISLAVIKEVRDYCDGFYLMTPFKRVGLISKIIEALRV